MIRRGVSILLLVVTSCTGAGQGTAPSTSPPASTTTIDSKPPDPGRLVVLDGSGDIVVMAPDGSDRIEVTSDAGVSAAYAQPVWSPDGESLAWGQVDDTGFAVGTQAVASTGPTTVSTPNLPFYMSWSPDGRRLGVLHNGSTGVVFGIVDLAGETLESVDEDAPFYFSWSPTGDSLVTHAGPDRVELVTPEGERTAIASTGPDYLSPQWTERGTFHVADGDLLVESDESREKVASTEGLTMFVANDRGTRLAVQTTGSGAISVAMTEPPEIPGSSVVVVDVGTGETHRIAEGLALGFFWSPDGERLLVLTPSGEQVVPIVWSSEGPITEFPEYRPAPAMVEDTFPFFPQYAQSIRFWSPDSSAFAFAGAVGGQEGIWVQHLDEEGPELVSDGRWVDWSPGRG